MKHEDVLKQILLAASREELFTFVDRAFHTLNPGQSFVPALYVRALCRQLERVESGEVTRLAIALPPRHLKSQVASVCFPAWALGRDPCRRIIGASYESSLAETFSKQCREVMLSAWYQEAFPRARLHPQMQTKAELGTTRHGYRLATSVGGPLTGKGGDILIIDDPLKADEAPSEANRRAVHHWYRGTLSSRLDNPKEGAIILVAQRLHVDDLFGHVVDPETWEVLELPAIARKSENIDVGAPVPWDREPGEILDPERVGEVELARIETELGSYLFQAQYQQNPQMPEGNLIKLEWFRRYEIEDCPETFDRIVQSWDTASVPGEGNSYSVSTTWGFLGKRLYLLDVLRRQLNYPDLKKTIVWHQKHYGAELVILEYAQSGVSLFQDLRKDGCDWIDTLKPAGDKETRAVQQSAKIEQGRVYLPAAAPWLQAFEDELAQFPHGKHDDQVDSLTQVLRLIDAEHKPVVTATYF